MIAKLWQGDCLDKMRGFPDKSIDLILCDLPYGVTACAWDSVIPFDALWEQYNRIAKDNAAVVLFSAQPFTTQLIQSNRKAFRYCWYWKKNNRTGAPFAKVQPMRCIEDICVFYKRKPTYNPQGLVRLEKPRKRAKKGTSNIYTLRGEAHDQHWTNYPHHLLEFDGVSGADRRHPTQKPVPLLEYLVRTYTNEGDTVLDNCMGSGSTGVACVNANRNFVGIEQDKNYYNTAVARIRAAQNDRNEVLAA